MAAARKFAYETVFAPDGAILRDPSGFRSQFTADEVEAERRRAFEEGRHVETVQAEKSAADAFERFAASAAIVVERLEAECTALRSAPRVL